MFSLAISGGEHGKGIGFAQRIGGDLVGDVSGGGRLLVARAAVVFLGLRNAEPKIGEAAPSLAILRRGGDDLGVEGSGAGQIVGTGGGFRRAFHFGDRLLNRARLFLQLRFQGDCGVVEGLVAKVVLGRSKGSGDKKNERGDEAGSDICAHFVPPGSRLQRGGMRRKT